MDYKKYLYKYVFLKDGRWFLVKEIINGIPYICDEKSKIIIPFCFEEEEIKDIADEVCKAITVE